MNREDYLSIGQFATISGIKRKNLIYYDEIGLFSPEITQDNGYRYYNFRQLYTINMILALKDVGMSLKDIKNFSVERTPEKTMQLFESQKDVIEAEIQKLTKIKGMMEMQISTLDESFHAKLHNITIEKCKKEPIFYGPKSAANEHIRLSKGTTDFFHYCSEHGYEYSYPWGIYLDLSAFKSEQFGKIGTFFYRVPISKTYRPAGYYVVAYHQGSYETYHEAHLHMKHFIEKRNLKMIGDGVYTDYILNEVSVNSP